MNRQPLLSVVVPARDEAVVLPEFHTRLSAVLSGLDVRAEIVYVDDGSTDGTWELLAGLAERDARVRAVRLSRSFGHQAALSAGIDRASGDAVVTIDADLQDPPELIPALVAKWREGFAVVHARRTRRLGEGWAKRAASFLFHRLLRLRRRRSDPRRHGGFPAARPLGLRGAPQPARTPPLPARSCRVDRPPPGRGAATIGNRGRQAGQSTDGGT